MATYESACVVQREMATRLITELLSASGTANFDRVLELGCGTGLLTRQLLNHCRLSSLTLNDLVPEFERTAVMARERSHDVTVRFLAGDMETIEFSDQHDLIVSNAVFQWAIDPRGLLMRLAELLRPGGFLAMASFGPSNLREVSQLTGLSLRYWSVDEWHATLLENYEVLSRGEDTRTLWFSSARDVLRHLKETGVNALDAVPWSRSKIVQFCRTYDATFGHDGKVPLTYQPVFLVARKRLSGNGEQR
jgi:malonyl-CoA O-methyltransferase